MENTQSTNVPAGELLEQWKHIPAIDGDQLRADIAAELDLEINDPFDWTAGE